MKRSPEEITEDQQMTSRISLCAATILAGLLATEKKSVLINGKWMDLIDASVAMAVGISNAASCYPRSEIHS